MGVVYVMSGSEEGTAPAPSMTQDAEIVDDNRIRVVISLRLLICGRGSSDVRGANIPDAADG